MTTDRTTWPARANLESDVCPISFHLTLAQSVTLDAPGLAVAPSAESVASGEEEDGGRWGRERGGGSWVRNVRYQTFLSSAFLLRWCLLLTLSLSLGLLRASPPFLSRWGLTFPGLCSLLWEGGREGGGERMRNEGMCKNKELSWCTSLVSSPLPGLPSSTRSCLLGPASATLHWLEGDTR